MCVTQYKSIESFQASTLALTLTLTLPLGVCMPLKGVAHYAGNGQMQMFLLCVFDTAENVNKIYIDLNFLIVKRCLCISTLASQ